jgi:poly(A) polymerase
MHAFLSLKLFIFFINNYICQMHIELTGIESLVTKKIAAAANELGVEAFIIGGFVRDKILDRPTKDIDIVCLGDGIALAEAVAQKFNPAPIISIFKTYGTAQIKINIGKKNDEVPTFLEIEFVGARKESYTAESRNPQVSIGSLEDDQNRRDFTINAFALSLQSNKYLSFIDPFNGMQDLENGIIKTPLDPDTTFNDDPLRMMRAIRFATQLNFVIDENTLASITKNAHRISIITQERITDELNKIMLSEKPSIGWDLLSKVGILEIIIPQMMALHGAEHVDGLGHKDNFYHTLAVLDNICPKTNDLWLRWAALLHDIGKPPTKKFEQGHGFTFHGHEAVGARMVPKIFTKLKLPLNEKMKFVQQLVLLHLRPICLTKENITDSAVRRLLFDAGDNIDDLMKLCKADITSKNRYKVKRFIQNFEMVQQRMKIVEAADNLRNWQPPITGEIIMTTFNLKPEKRVGIIKDAIREAILDGVIANNYEVAFEFMMNLANKLDLVAVGA